MPENNLYDHWKSLAKMVGLGPSDSGSRDSSSRESGEDKEPQPEVSDAALDSVEVVESEQGEQVVDSTAVDDAPPLSPAAAETPAPLFDPLGSKSAWGDTAEPEWVADDQGDGVPGDSKVQEEVFAEQSDDAVDLDAAELAAEEDDVEDDDAVDDEGEAFDAWSRLAGELGIEANRPERLTKKRPKKAKSPNESRAKSAQRSKKRAMEPSEFAVGLDSELSGSSGQESAAADEVEGEAVFASELQNEDANIRADRDEKAADESQDWLSGGESELPRNLFGGVEEGDSSKSADRGRSPLDELFDVAEPANDETAAQEDEESKLDAVLDASSGELFVEIEDPQEGDEELEQSIENELELVEVERLFDDSEGKPDKGLRSPRPRPYKNGPAKEEARRGSDDASESRRRRRGSDVESEDRGRSARGESESRSDEEERSTAKSKGRRRGKKSSGELADDQGSRSKAESTEREERPRGGKSKDGGSKRGRDKSKKSKAGKKNEESRDFAEDELIVDFGESEPEATEEKREGGSRSKKKDGDKRKRKKSDKKAAKVEEDSIFDDELFDDEIDEAESPRRQRGASKASEREERGSKQRKLPTWTETIGLIVDKNLDSRRSAPSSSGGRRGGGGRGSGGRGTRRKRTLPLFRQLIDARSRLSDVPT